MKLAQVRFLLPLLAMSLAFSGEPAIAASPATGTVASSLIPPPPAGTGLIVFYRTGDFMGIGSGCSVSRHGTKISKLGQSRFFIVAAQPGKYEFTVHGEGTDTLTLEVESGETQYVLCRILVGLTNVRPDLRPSTEAEFLKAKTTHMVDDEDMGPGPGAMRARDVARAISEAALAGDAGQ